MAMSKLAVLQMAGDNQTRRALLGRRMLGDDDRAQIAELQSPQRPTTPAGSVTHQRTPSVPAVQAVSRPPSVDPILAKLEIEKQKRSELDQHKQKLIEIASSLIEKSAIAESQLRTHELMSSHSRLGMVMTNVSGTVKWSGGIEIERNEATIASLTAKLAQNPQHKHLLQAQLKEAKAKQKKLEEERIQLAYRLRFVSDQETSKFHPGDRLNESRYILEEYIGRGGFSEVWKALDVQNVRHVAIKIQYMNPEWPDQFKKNFMRHAGREIIIMSSTQHENVVGFYEHFYIGDDTVALVIELCPGGDLAQLLRLHGKLSEKDARLILLQVIQGLRALRSKEDYVIHYDLKPANILFDNEGRVKVADFGLSKVIENDVTALELTSQGTGTYYYAAPETFLRGRSVFITPSVDTWSLGVIFYEMLYGTRPFGGDCSQLVFAQRSDTVFDEGLQFPASAKVSEEAKEFIRTCLERDPSKRPKLEEIAQGAYCSVNKN
jgi:tousled-like kinase